MEFIFIFLLGITSASITSFLVAMDSRNWKNISSRSKCSCGANIKSKNLIPIIGSVLAKFKCYSCNEKFSKNMFISELSAFFISISIFLIYNKGYLIDTNSILSINFFIIIISSAFLSLIIYEDITSFTVSDIYSILGILPLLYVFKNIYPFLAVVGAIYVFKLLADNYLAFRIKDASAEAMGEGDIIVFGLLGIFLTNPQDILNSIILISILGIIFKYIFFKKDNFIPFVPAIIFGTIIYTIFGTFL